MNLKHWISRTIGVFALLIASANHSSANESVALVQTPLGLLQGLHEKSEGVVSFKGIRYAHAQRFEPARSIAPWTGIQKAVAFGNNCPQTARYELTEASLDEDCLFLNITAPDQPTAHKKLPVMVWIPGGQFLGGGANLYDARRLARLGQMVVVTLNYRVGLFGFMAHPAMQAATNGTLGLADQIEALRWVKNNISAFGGDPNNITLAGESAGSGSICQHITNPVANRGLFHKAILMSGSCLQPIPTLDWALSNPIWQAVSHNPKDAQRKFRCPTPSDPGYSDQASLQCLRKTSVFDLLQAQTFEAGNRLLSFMPVSGNQIVPRSFKEALATGQLMKIPMVMGGARDELRLYVAYDVLGENNSQTSHPINLESLKKYYLPAFYGSDPSLQSKIIQRYFASDTKPINLNGASLGSMLSDFNPHVGLSNCLYLKTSNALNGVPGMAPIYQFEFADSDAPVLGVGLAPGKNPGFELGAVHSAILNYLFPHFSNTAAINAPSLPAHSDRLANVMIEYLANFMRHGTPSAQGQASWTRYDGTVASPRSETVMLFQPGASRPYAAWGGPTTSSRDAHQCAYWASLYPN